MPAITVQPNNAIYPSNVGDRRLSNGLPSSAVNLTPNQADRFTKQSKQENSLELESPSQSKVSPWVWAVGGLATLGVIGLVGWAWWKNKNPESAAKGATGAVNQFVTPHKDPNFTGIQPKRSVEEVIELCKQVMEVGNEEGACQTMSVLNSLHLYKKLAEIDPTFDESNAANRIEQLLKAGRTRKALKETTFEFLSSLKPEVYATYLQNNQIGRSNPYHCTQMIPHFIAEYALNQPVGSFHTVGGMNNQDLVATLKNLCEGKIGVLGSTEIIGGHVVSLVGIAEEEQGAIDTLIKGLSQETPKIDPTTLKKIKLLIYDQWQSNHNEAVGSIPLIDVLGSSSDQANYYSITLFGQETLNKPLHHSLIRQNSPVWDEIETDAFHQHLMNTGNAVFNAT
ncbi:MAG: hypothetical protein H2174_05470 [Vampirovibrio sp.]|nr:hypothetical protein [Vampirovibrio sp.]